MRIIVIGISLAIILWASCDIRHLDSMSQIPHEPYSLGFWGEFIKVTLLSGLCLAIFSRVFSLGKSRVLEYEGRIDRENEAQRKKEEYELETMAGQEAWGSLDKDEQLKVLDDMWKKGEDEH